MHKSSQQAFLLDPMASTSSPESEPLFKLTVPGRLASWNEILGMEQWQRYQFKEKLAQDFLCALRASESDSSMKTTCAANTTWTYSAILASYLQTRRELRRSKLAKKKLLAKSRSAPPLKSIPLTEIPF